MEKCVDAIHETLAKVDAARARAMTVRGKKSHTIIGKMVGALPGVAYGGWRTVGGV